MPAFLNGGMGYTVPMKPVFRTVFALCAAACLMCPPLRAQTPVPVTITVTSGARQTFHGFGASALNFGHEYQTLTPAERTTLSRTLWHDLGFHTLRLWANMDKYAPTPGAHDLTQFRGCYVDSHLIADARAQGVTTLLLAPDGLPPYMAEKRPDGSAQTGMALKDSEVDNYADLLADFIARLRTETGTAITVTGIQNEPNDLERFTPAQIVRVVKRLRVDLDKQGLPGVQIIAPENASADDSLYAQLDALKADPAAWTALSGIASHSYNMAATDKAASYITGTQKRYWMTEASDNGPEAPGDGLRAASLASRFLSDMNHGVTDWVHFVGFEVPDANDNATRILAYTPKPFAVTYFQKYYYYKQLSEAFPVGSVFRKSESTLDGGMTYTYGKKPHVTAAAARTPYGAWAIGLSNYTSPTFTDADNDKDFVVHNSGYAAQTYAVTVRVPELAKVPVLRFQIRRSTATVGDAPAGSIVMRYGTVTVPALAPLELITLRSSPNAR